MQTSKTLLVWALVAVTLPTFCAENGQRLCETDRRLCITGLCPIDECLQCDNTAICETSDPDQVVPRKLPPHTRYLNLTYTGPEVELTTAMFDYLPILKKITIHGNIASIAPNTFIKQQNLKWLTIANAALNSLPTRLVHNNSRLQHLNLPNNQFTQIPVNVFPSILAVRRIDLSYNPLNSCRSENDTIAQDFEMLQHLETLILSGYGSSRELCQNVSNKYLFPIRRVKVLELSESLLFYGDQRMLSPLTNLQRLTINKVESYRYCPVLARELFNNLPQELNSITLRYWASTQQVNDSCMLNDDALTGLKKLKKLSTIDTRYGDKIFGNVLEPSVFDGFNRLRVLYINWCGIASISNGAFNALPHVANLGLGGNLLGPRVLELYTNSQPSKLVTLNLNAVGINTVTYYASSLLLSFSHLKLLYLDSNFLSNIPHFGWLRNVSSTVTTLTLNKNNIQSLSAEDGERLCKVMQSLEVFKVEQNKISDITGLIFCLSLKQLYLANNLIGKNQYNNFMALRQLNRMNHLDISYNKIRYLPPEVFANLTNLWTLNLANNEITTLSNDVFMATPHLRSLDLSANFLSTFNSSIVSTRLSGLVNVYLQDNQISELSEELLDIISTRLSKMRTLGLVGNPLTCSCDDYFSKWVRNSSIIMQVKNLTCSTPDDPDLTTKVLNYQPNYFLCRVKLPLMIFAEVLAGGAVSVLLAVPCYKYRWYVSHPKVVARAIAEKLKEVQFDHKCEYDAFISYNTGSNKDSEWVVAKLVPAIEKVTDREATTRSDKMKLYAVDRDSAAGSPKYTERCRAIESSRKIIILLSNSYLANPDCLSEADLVAGYQFLDGHHCYQPNRILVLILEDLNEEAIKAPVTALLTESVIHVTENEAKMKRTWQRVRRFISKPRYVYRRNKRIEDTQDVHSLDTESPESADPTDPLIQQNLL